MSKRIGIIAALVSALGLLSACGARQTKQSIYKDIEGKWRVAAMGENKIAPEKDQLQLTFDLRSGRVGGYGVCNSFGGSFVLRPNGKIQIKDIMTTMVGCDGNILEAALNRALENTERIEVKDGKAYLYGANDPAALLTLERP